jgi:MFS family permease
MCIGALASATSWSVSSLAVSSRPHSSPRVWSGHYADRRGAKRAVVVGLLTAVAAGLLYLMSLMFLGTPSLSVTILLFGRALLGGAESFVIMGAVSWGLTLVGPANAGRVIAWVGMSMFAALAFGAPVGTMLYATGGFAAVAVATILVPLITVLLVAPLSSVPAQRGAQAGLMKVLGAVWLPGLGAALSSVGFGAMISFSSLLAAERSWNPLWLTFSAFATALVADRPCGHRHEQWTDAGRDCRDAHASRLLCRMAQCVLRHAGRQGRVREAAALTEALAVSFGEKR